MPRLPDKDVSLLAKEWLELIEDEGAMEGLCNADRIKVAAAMALMATAAYDGED